MRKGTEFLEGIITDSKGEKFIGKLHKDIYHTWDKNGDYHSIDDKPALNCITDKAKLYNMVNCIYFNRGNWHRDNGPAVFLPGDIEEYWINDKLHREDGPAIVYPKDRNGRHDTYYLNGQNVQKESIDKLILQKQLHKFKDL